MVSHFACRPLAAAAVLRRRPATTTLKHAYRWSSSSTSSSVPPNLLPLRTALLIAVVSAVGGAAGAGAAYGLSRSLDSLGIFHYVPEDEENDDDDDGDDEDDGVLSAGAGKNSAAVTVALASVAPLASRLALEANGDLGVNVTVNLQSFDVPARAFQLLQLRSFLSSLDDALAAAGDDTAIEDPEIRADVDAARAYATQAAHRIEARLQRAAAAQEKK